MTTAEVILIGGCVVLVLLPPRYDPAIRWKERLQRGIDARRHPGRVCARQGHDWRHYGGRNAGCSRDCGCSVPVNECARCGDCDYGENAEAQETITACPTAADVRACTCQFGYDMVDGIGYRAMDCPVHGEDDLPEGLFLNDGKVMFNCQVCDVATELPVDVAEYDPEGINLCGGSPRCCP